MTEEEKKNILKVLEMTHNLTLYAKLAIYAEITGIKWPPEALKD
jgi:hypothetical protein